LHNEPHSSYCLSLLLLLFFSRAVSYLFPSSLSILLQTRQQLSCERAAREDDQAALTDLRVATDRAIEEQRGLREEMKSAYDGAMAQLAVAEKDRDSYAAEVTLISHINSKRDVSFICVCIFLFIIDLPLSSLHIKKSKSNVAVFNNSIDSR
jgi:hypothetical protein